MIIISFRPL